jgi:hypothetical protein
MDGLGGAGGAAVHTQQASAVVMSVGTILGHGYMMGGTGGCALSALNAKLGIKCNFGSQNNHFLWKYYKHFGRMLQDLRGKIHGKSDEHLFLYIIFDIIVPYIGVV